MELKFLKDLEFGKVTKLLIDLKKGEIRSRLFFYIRVNSINFMSSETISGPILTSDGIPLKVSLKKAERINKIRAFLLVLPLLAFILISFIIPPASFTRITPAAISHMFNFF